MATYYWVGGSGTWDQTATANWASTSGGPGNAGCPTSADDVIFDANSDTGGPFTVTIGGTLTTNTPFCKTFTTGGAGGALDQTMTLAGSGRLYLYGSMTLPAANFVYTHTGRLTFQDSATLITNGVTLTSGITIAALIGSTLVFNLGSAVTCVDISLSTCTFNTNNFNVTLSAGFGLFVADAIRTVNLGSSTITTSASSVLGTATNTAGITFNAGTSTINCSNANPTFNGGGLTFNNVSFTSTASGGVTITGANTFNNLTFAGKTGTTVSSVILPSGQTQTITGTLTFSPSASAISRIFVRAATYRQQATINVAAVAAFQDIDFRDIVITGAAAPISGTRIGNALNNSGITFTAGTTKYWSLAAGGNWTSTAWALTSGGAPAVNNYPLAQDTVIIEDTGLNSGATITFNLSAPVGNFTTATRTLPATIAFGTSSPGFYGNVTLSSAITMTGSGALIGLGAIYGTTQTITSAGVTWPRGLSISPVSGTTVFADALTVNGQVSCSFGTTPNITGTVQFKNGVTHTATSFVFSAPNTSRVTVASTVPGSTYTLSCSTGFVNAYFTTISDSVVTGGAIWTAALYYGNVNGGNNTGWNFPALSAINRGVPTSLSFGFRF